MIRLAFIALVTIAAASPTCDCNKDLSLLQWTGGSFHWPCSSTKEIYKNSGRYIAKNVIATRGQLAANKLFLAIPRYRCGVPVTLAVTSIKRSGCQPALEPFPCWSMQEEGNCKALQSVIDVYVDANDILWVLDTGVVNSLEAPTRKCPPKVVAFNVKTKKILKVLDLSGLVCSASRLQYVVVDYSADGRCFVYVSDATTRAILVFDVAAGKGYRVVLPKAITMGCGRRDVLYLALVRKSTGNNILYFTYLSSNRMFSINTQYLRSGSASGKVQDVGPKPDRLVVIGTDGGCAIFFRIEGQSDVLRWDSSAPFKRANFVPVYRSPTCLLATHAMPDFKRGKMRVLESNFPDFIQDTVGCGAVHQVSPVEGCF